MTVSFIGTEASAFTLSNSTDVTTGGTFRSANSRGSMGYGSTVQSAYAEWDSALGEGWIHYISQGTKDNDGTDNLIVVTTSAGVNLFRLATFGINTVGAQYWNGSAWANAGTTYASSIALCDVAIRLVAGGSGLFEVYENGILMDSGSVPFVGTDMKRVTFYTGDNDIALYYSEVMLGDDAVSLAISTVETEAPTANGTDTDGTGSYTDVDEIPYSDVDGIALANAGDANSFTSPARTSTLYTVLGVSVAARMKCDVTGPQGAKFYLKIGGTPYYSGNFALTTGMKGYQYTWPLNPATGLAWTTTDANAATLEWGIEAVA